MTPNDRDELYDDSANKPTNFPASPTFCQRYNSQSSHKSSTTTFIMSDQRYYGSRYQRPQPGSLQEAHYMVDKLKAQAEKHQAEAERQLFLRDETIKKVFEWETKVAERTANPSYSASVEARMAEMRRANAAKADKAIKKEEDDDTKTG
ncbi:hypothetical protein FPOAC2_10451 [Fusarium poae]